MFAHFFKGTKTSGGPCVVISRDCTIKLPSVVETIMVKDKREAGRIAADRNATRWNF